jgi:hypothetical protein
MIYLYFFFPLVSTISSDAVSEHFAFKRSLLNLHKKPSLMLSLAYFRSRQIIQGQFSVEYGESPREKLAKLTMIMGDNSKYRTQITDSDLSESYLVLKEISLVLLDGLGDLLEYDKTWKYLKKRIEVFVSTAYNGKRHKDIPQYLKEIRYIERHLIEYPFISNRLKFYSEKLGKYYGVEDIGAAPDEVITSIPSDWMKEVIQVAAEKEKNYGEKFRRDFDAWLLSIVRDARLVYRIPPRSVENILFVVGLAKSKNIFQVLHRIKDTVKHSMADCPERVALLNRLNYRLSMAISETLDKESKRINSTALKAALKELSYFLKMHRQGIMNIEAVKNGHEKVVQLLSSDRSSSESLSLSLIDLESVVLGKTDFNTTELWDKISRNHILDDLGNINNNSLTVALGLLGNSVPVSSVISSLAAMTVAVVVLICLVFRK